MDEDACDPKPVEWPHPDGFARPRCHRRDRTAVHRRRRPPALDDRCGHRDRTPPGGGVLGADEAYHNAGENGVSHREPEGPPRWRGNNQYVCYTNGQAVESRAGELIAFLHRMGREARQGAVGLVIDRDYLEIGFPPEETPKPERSK